MIVRSYTMGISKQTRHLLYVAVFTLPLILFIYGFTDTIIEKGSTYMNSRVWSAIRNNTSNCNVNRTLLIINGQVRDFKEVWNWTYTRLVLPNEPCDVILSIHGSKTDIPEVVLQGFGNHITAILTTDTETPVGHTDFWMTARAVRKIQPERYTHIIKTRSELFHRLPISMKTVYGDDKNFIQHFRRFHKNLTEKTGRTNFTVAETLYAWIMTSGLAELIPTMVMKTPIIVWCKLAPNDWNRNVRIALEEQCKTAGIIMLDGDGKRDREIVQILKTTMAKYKVVYNFGGNWLQYGPTEHMVPLSIKTADEFGQHTWADLGYNDSDNMHNKQWRHVGESQMRLTHLKGGYHLVDIIHLPDLEMSFSIPKTFRQALSDNDRLFFIARSKERYMRNWNLTDPATVQYW